MIFFDLLRQNLRSYTGIRPWVALFFFCIEIAISVFSSLYLIRRGIISPTPEAASNLVAAVGLYSSALLAGIIQLHSQIKSLIEEKTIVVSKRMNASDPEEMSNWAYRIMFSEAKVLAARHLFSNMMFSLYVSFFLTATLVLYTFLSEKYVHRNFLGYISCALLAYFCIINFKIANRVFIYMNDDFYQESRDSNVIK